MRWQYERNPITGERRFYFALTNDDLEKLWHPTSGELDRIDRALLESVDENSVADLLLGLELIARRLEQAGVMVE